jgi:hypothetical protein
MVCFQWVYSAKGEVLNMLFSVILASNQPTNPLIEPSFETFNSKSEVN